MEQKRAAEEKPGIKICGITDPGEAAYLNEASVSYAGFVFFPKSKRNVTYEQAEKIFSALDPSIPKVAVFVSPTLAEIQRAEGIGADILKIHGTLAQEIIKKSRHPIWRAVNIKFGSEFLEKEELFYDNITGIVVDGAQYGGGKTFDWSTNGALLSVREQFADKAFILAGGLNSENVKTGISIFAPDIVDVSSGVENDNGIGKNRDKIMEFVRKVKEHE